MGAQKVLVNQEARCKDYEVGDATRAERQVRRWQGEAQPSGP